MWFSRLWRELNRQDAKIFRGFALFAPFAVGLFPVNPEEPRMPNGGIPLE